MSCLAVTPSAGRRRRLLHLQLDLQIAELFRLVGAGRVGHQARAFRGFRERESQRDSGLQPKVATQELPWVIVPHICQPQRGWNL